MYCIQVAQNIVSGGHFVNTALPYRARNKPGIILTSSAITGFCRTVLCEVSSGFRSQYSYSYIIKFYLQQSDWLYPNVLKKRRGWGTLVEPKASQSINQLITQNKTFLYQFFLPQWPPGFGLLSQTEQWISEGKTWPILWVRNPVSSSSRPQVTLVPHGQSIYKQTVLPTPLHERWVPSL
jgi:hypothetical protein